MPWRYYDDPPPYYPDYREGFPRYRHQDRDVLEEAKRGIRFYKSVLAEQERIANKKKDKEKKKGYTMPQLTVGQFVAFSMISWPFIGLIERWAVRAIFN